jgi:hypothetical protein
MTPNLCLWVRRHGAGEVPGRVRMNSKMSGLMIFSLGIPGGMKGALGARS